MRARRAFGRLLGVSFEKERCGVVYDGMFGDEELSMCRSMNEFSENLALSVGWPP